MASEGNKKSSRKILIVDDVIINLEILKSILEEEGYEPLDASSVQEAIDIMNESMPQLILSDISMPEMDGLEFCRLVKSNPRTRDIPFVFITVLNSPEEKEQAFLAGAVDFIPKPFERVEVIMRVRNQLNSYQMKKEMENYNRMMHKLVSEQQKQIEEEQRNMLFALAKVVEKRNVSTGQHLENVAYNSRLLAQGLQFLSEFEEVITDEFVETIGPASKVRDIGNLVITNPVLLNRNSNEEPETGGIGQHTEEGARILEEIYNERTSTKFISMAIKIARFHHEKWDGTGYPQKLKENEIPLEARIVALADAFEMLLSTKDRSDEEAVEECIRIINEGSGTTFEPAMVGIFNKLWKQMKID
uniref:response regulator n=1 Tax=Agathobacter sp. TaxID=2021311 RepID=UPI0040569FEB